MAIARTNKLPYPQRAIRTGDYLYIRNFKPQRWPMGTAPGYGQTPGNLPDKERLRRSTTVAFADLDASPTKAYVAIDCRNEANQKYFDWAFGRRPAEELYDLKKDPHQINNVAADPAYAKAKTELSKRLITILKENNDPRVQGDGSKFDQPPFAQ